MEQRWIAAVLVAGSSIGCGGDVSTSQEPAPDAAAPPTCEVEGWRVFEAQNLFRFHAPCSLQGGPEQGQDSLIGSYEDDGWKMSYDYGSYSSTLTEWVDHAGYSKQAALIDGRDAYFVTAEDPGAIDGSSYVAGVHVPDVGIEGVRLTVYGAAIEPARRETLLAVLATLDFP